jgi:hypothetical protein
MKVALRPKADIREARENTAERERPISEPIAGPTRVIPRTFIPPQAAYLPDIRLVKAKNQVRTEAKRLIPRGE